MLAVNVPPSRLLGSSQGIEHGFLEATSHVENRRKVGIRAEGVVHRPFRFRRWRGPEECEQPPRRSASVEPSTVPRVTRA